MANLSRFRFLAALAIPATVSLSPAQATTADEVNERVLCNVDAKTRAVFVELHPEFKAVKCNQGSATHQAVVGTAAKSAAAANRVVTAKESGKIDPKSDPPAGGGTGKSPPSPISFLLRNDWSDTGLLGASCLQPPAGDNGGSSGSPVITKPGAKGASLSFTRDYANNNKIWASQAMAAAVYSECDLSIVPRHVGGTSGVLEKSIAIYAQINSSYNSNAQLAKKNNADTRTVGLSGELAYSSGPNINVFRLTPNVVFDNVKNTTAVAVKAQYIPYWYGLLWSAIPIFNNTSNLHFDPALDLQYANAMGKSKPLQFSGKDQSLRIGPELTVIIAPLFSQDNFFSHIGINETFHPWYEAYTGHGSYWWSNAIFYNFTKDGSFAVSLSYNRGLDENSGTMTNQYIVSLTGKY